MVDPFSHRILPVLLLIAVAWQPARRCQGVEPPDAGAAARPPGWVRDPDRPPLPFPAAFPPVFPAPQQLTDLLQGRLADDWGTLTDAERARLQQIPVSPREESEAGRQAVQAKLADLRRRGLAVVQRGSDYEYVRQLVDGLRPRLRNGPRYPRIQVYLIDSPDIDARSFPGGTLFFTRGMLDFAHTEAALVGVVGHELSHLDHGHQLLHLRRWKLAQQNLTGQAQGFSPQQFLQDGLLLGRMFSRPYQPEDEAQADLDGAGWAYQAGYDPRAMAELFRRRQQDEAPNLAFVDFFRSHPPNEERFQAILKLHGQLQQQTPRPNLYLGRENLVRRIPRSRREFDE